MYIIYSLFYDRFAEAKNAIVNLFVFLSQSERPKNSRIVPTLPSPDSTTVSSSCHNFLFEQLFKHYKFSLSPQLHSTTMKVRNPIAKLIKPRAGKVNKWSDEDSLSGPSTHSVGEFTRKSLTSSFSSHTPLKRRVSFAENENQYHVDNTMLSEEETEDLWYSADDLEDFKKSNNFACQTARRTASSANADSYHGCLEAAYQACSNGELLADASALEGQLQLWPARAGLEQRMIKQYSKDKQHRREAILQLFATTDIDPQELGRACEELSQPARLFAHQIARAQAA